jgi:hypothetical protein
VCELQSKARGRILLRRGPGNVCAVRRRRYQPADLAVRAPCSDCRASTARSQGILLDGIVVFAGYGMVSRRRAPDRQRCAEQCTKIWNACSTSLVCPRQPVDATSRAMSHCNGGSKGLVLLLTARSIHRKSKLHHTIYNYCSTRTATTYTSFG